MIILRVCFFISMMTICIIPREAHHLLVLVSGTLIVGGNFVSFHRSNHVLLLMDFY